MNRIKTLVWPTRLRPIALLSASAGLLAGCVASRSGPEAIAHLERQLAQRPNAAAVHRSLGIAYYKQERFGEARMSLEEASRRDPKDAVAALYLGLTAEAQDDLPAARAAYSTYLRFGRTNRVRKQLDDRLRALQRRELELAAKSAVSRENELAGVRGSPTTVAVLPFTFSGTDSSYKPLERGFAELITTDLALLPQLTVVERARLQAILDELALQGSGATDASTNVRAGKLIQAGSLVTGELNLTGDQLRAASAVVNVETSQAGSATANTMSLDQLFALENEIVFGIVDHFGIRLTTAQRNAIERRPTRSMQAFLAYSQGLEAEDRGQYDEAGRFFQDATRLDPGFSRAQQKGRDVQAVIVGSQVTGAAVEAGLSGSSEGAIASSAAQGVVTQAITSNTVMTAAANLNPSVAGAATGGVIGTSSLPTGPEAGTGLGADKATTQAAEVWIRIRVPPTP